MNAHLTKYIEQKNVWRRLTNTPELDVANLSLADCEFLHESLECDMSPENLTCDGELRGGALLRKTNTLMRASRELAAIKKELE